MTLPAAIGEVVLDDMDTADVLDAAADYLRTFGWKQCGFGNDGEPRCAVGAIWSASADGKSGFLGLKAHDVLRVALDNVAPDVWNDAPGRTAEEVIDALQEAAAELRGKEQG